MLNASTRGLHGFYSPWVLGGPHMLLYKAPCEALGPATPVKVSEQ